MLITEKKLRNIIKEELKILEEEKLEEIGWKDIAPWALAGAAALSPLKAKGQEATTQQNTPSITQQSSSEEEGSEDIQVGFIGCSENAIADSGGEENIQKIQGMVETSINEVIEYFSRPKVQKKLLDLSGVKALPDDFINKLRLELSLQDSKTDEGNFKISVWSGRDVRQMIGKKGVYYPSLDILALNANLIGLDINDFSSTIEHEVHHKALHKIKNILNLQGDQIFKLYMPDHKDEDHLASEKDRNFSSYLKKPIEAAAYSYVTRNTLGISDITSKSEVIQKIQQVIKKANNGTRLIHLGNGFYCIVGNKSWHKGLESQDVSTQFVAAIGSLVGQDRAEQIGRTIMPFSKKISKDGKTFTGFYLNSLVKSLNSLASRDTNSNVRTV